MARRSKRDPPPSPDRGASIADFGAAIAAAATAATVATTADAGMQQSPPPAQVTEKMTGATWSASPPRTAPIARILLVFVALLCVGALLVGKLL